MPRLAALIVGLALLAPAHGAVLWTVNDLTTPGGSVIGSFAYDSTTMAYESIALTASVFGGSATSAMLGLGLVALAWVRGRKFGFIQSIE